MDTPIVDFVKTYVDNKFSRFHMPGHKGVDFLGYEKYDITEIDGADVLGEAEGIIGESENNATELFGTKHTFYSAQGSTSVICAMLSIIARFSDNKPLILAARNVHKAFIHGCALLDIDVEWIMPETLSHVTKCHIDAECVEKSIKSCPTMPDAVYVTSPDYLGNILDIASIAKVCDKFGVPLLVDNAHGAYLAFADSASHPIHCGAAMCCDSAHKTLPVLTGGAYLHVGKNAPESFVNTARDAISLFSSTSPSYLILQSLDMCNSYIDSFYRENLKSCIKTVEEYKKYISGLGFTVMESEPLKIVIDALQSGFTGEKLGSIMRDGGVEPEFCDRDFVVLMITPQNTSCDFERLKSVFDKLMPDTPIKKDFLTMPIPEKVMSIREAVLSVSEKISAIDAKGRVCATPTVSCPPAVPIAISGERITDEHIRMFGYYGIDKIAVVKDA